MKFGFVIPVFNTVKYLKNCLISIINQTYKNFEVVIVDNYSSDGSYEVAKNFSLKYKNIKLFRKKISGVGRIRDFAIEKLDCDYFITIDSDDYVDRKLLEMINSKIDIDRSIDMVRYNATKVDENQVELEDSMFITKHFGLFSGQNYLKNVCLEYIEHSKIFGPTWLYAIKTTFYKKNKFKFSRLLQEDFGLTSSLIIKSKKILSINFNGYFYLQRANSITNNKVNKYLKAIHLLNHYDNYVKKIINSSLYDIELKKIFKNYLDLSLINKYKSLSETDKESYMIELEKRGIIIKQ